MFEYVTNVGEHAHLVVPVYEVPHAVEVSVCRRVEHSIAQLCHACGAVGVSLLCLACYPDAHVFIVYVCIRCSRLMLRPLWDEDVLGEDRDGIHERHVPREGGDEASATCRAYE